MAKMEPKKRPPTTTVTRKKLATLEAAAKKLAGIEDAFEQLAVRSIAELVEKHEMEKDSIKSLDVFGNLLEYLKSENITPDLSNCQKILASAAADAVGYKPSTMGEEKAIQQAQLMCIVMQVTSIAVALGLDIQEEWQNIYMRMPNE